jgi:hypothetical protein
MVMHNFFFCATLLAVDFDCVFPHFLESNTENHPPSEEKQRGKKRKELQAAAGPNV